MQMIYSNTYEKKKIVFGYVRRSMVLFLKLFDKGDHELSYHITILLSARK